MPVNPLNMPIPDYVALCNAPAASLKPFLIFPHLIIDEQYSTEALVTEAFNLGYTARAYRKELSRHNTLALAVANSLCHKLYPIAQSSSSAVHPILMDILSRISGYIPIPRVVVIPNSLKAELLPRQLDWMKNGTYWVHGCELYWNAGIQGVARAIAIAMVLLDRHVLEAGTIDPQAHLPLNLAAQAETDFKTIVSDVYSKGDAMWHFGIFAIHVGISITFRALHTGFGRDKAVQEFISSGRMHYLL